MGLRAYIYKSALHCHSNNAISSAQDCVTIVNIGGPFEPSDDAPAVLVIDGYTPGTLRIIPQGGAETRRRWMFGGCYVNGDSRFSERTGHYLPLPLHDLRG